LLSNRDGDWALYSMSANGGNQRRVFPAGLVEPFGESVGRGEPVVSPDGRNVLLAGQGITVASLVTGVSKRIGPGDEAAAAWSPDGSRIVFGGENGGLYVVDVRGGPKRALLRASQTGTPVWSPDGRWIAFARQIGYGPTEIYVIHPDGSALQRLTVYGPASGLAWSRDGRLAFIGTRGTMAASHLVVIDVRRRLVHVMQPRLGNGTVAWSPDGQRIAYAATTPHLDASSIYMANADGSGLRELTPPEPRSYDTSPVWSPDGRSLLFVRSPVGGGATRGISEVWMMRSDGSHQRPLTQAFPSGGDNLEPAWVSSAVYAEPAPRSLEVRRGRGFVLRVPFAVDGISAEGDHAAIAPVAYEMQRDTEPTPPILIWRPGHGEPTRLGASACGGVRQLVLAGSRLAFDCNNTFLDEIEQSVWIFDLRTGVPREVFSGSGGGSDNRGLYLDNIAGGGGLLAFGSERDDARGVARLRTVWRMHRFDSIALRSSSHAGNVVAAGGGRIAVELADGRVALMRADGTLIRVLRLVRHPSAVGASFGADPKSPFLLAGSDLLFLEGGTLQAYATATGKLQWERRVPAGAQLEAADGGLVIYTAGSTIHILSHGSEKVVRTGVRLLPRLRFDVQRLVYASLTADGLYYCFNVADRRYPGRVVFLPREALQR
jgi:Tol biopolymer transport system component